MLLRSSHVYSDVEDEPINVNINVLLCCASRSTEGRSNSHVT